MSFTFNITSKITSTFLLLIVFLAACNPSSNSNSGSTKQNGGNGSSNAPVIPAETTPTDVLKALRDQCKADVAKFDNYALIMEDSTMSVYVRKILESGKPKVETRVTAKDEQGKDTPVSNQNPYELWNRGGCGNVTDAEITEIAKTSKVDVKASLKDKPMIGLTITQKGLKQMGASAFNEAPAGTDTTHIQIWIDPTGYAVRQMKRTQSDKDSKGVVQKVELTAQWDDYKEVKGLSLPHSSTLIVEGKGIGLTAPQMAEAKKKIENDRTNVLPTLPKEVQAQAKKQLAMQEKQLAGMSENRIEQTMRLAGAKVNEGIPNGVF